MASAGVEKDVRRVTLQIPVHLIKTVVRNIVETKDILNYVNILKNLGDVNLELIVITCIWEVIKQSFKKYLKLKYKILKLKKITLKKKLCI